MACELINIESGERVGLPPVATIGRKRDCTVFLPDQRVSRQHAMIRLQSGGYYWITDMGSFNGSFVNGQRVTTGRKLNHGDVIRICDFEYRYDHEESSTPHIADDMTTQMTMVDIRHIDALILVSDMIGFTAISEKLAPGELAQIVGGFYKSCNETMARHGATIDKFIGDAVLAYWSEVNESNRQAALQAANELVHACYGLDEKNRGILAPHGLKIGCGVGLHVGSVVMSPVAAGVQTILGDAVNLSFRLESLSRMLGRTVLLSENFTAGWESCPTDLIDCGVQTVKGRDSGVRVLALG